jgi:arabinofuranosyltransferase
MNAAWMMLFWALTLPSGLSEDDAITMSNGFALIGSELPTEAALGQEIRVDLYFKVPGPLEDNMLNFLHMEVVGDEGKCRLVRDERPKTIDGGLMHHSVTFKIPDDGKCQPGQRLLAYTGLYNNKTWDRVAVEGMATQDDRIFAGSIELVASGASDERQAFGGSDIRRERFWTILKPWWSWIGWLSAFTVAIAALGWWSLRRQRAASPDAPLATLPVTESFLEHSPPISKRLRWIMLGLLAVPAILSVLITFDFIKDDAYISFRYTHNIIVGDGMVFNAGDRLEGFTNFLWVIVMLPFEALKLDLFQVSEVLGGLLVVLLVWDAGRIQGLIVGEGRGMSWMWPALLLATSSNTALWATSGMEQPLAMWLPVAAALALWRGYHATPRRNNLAIASGVLIGLGCMTRPEVHLIGALLGLPLLWEWIKTRKLNPFTLRWGASLLAVTVPFHLFRFLYFGSVVPNTYYVKTSPSALVWMTGLGKLHEMFDFNHLGWMVCLIPAAFISRRFLAEKLIMLATTLGFMAHLVRVGVDEMHWHRLFLPALPFLVILTTLGLQHIVEALIGAFKRTTPESRMKWLRWQAYGAGWALVLAAAISSFIFSYKEKAGFNGRGELSGMNHPDVGKFVTRHDLPGALVAFQDMGSTPYHAPDIAFLDFIGLVDSTVAKTRHKYGLHAFMGTEAHHFQKQFDAEMREYFYKRNPEWTILTTYIGKGDADRFAKTFAKDPTPDSLGSAMEQNSFQFGFWDKTFRERYVHVRTWQHSTTYYLSLFRRRDLWVQVPKEVVLDAPPARMDGQRVQFEQGLELLGWEIEQDTVREKQEFFVTSWWRVPGPMPADTFFFIHVNRPDYQAPFDHRPGDSMYPADRWEAGQIIEHRVLLPMPPHMKEGEYDVWLGVYRRGTDQRLKVEDGPHDGGHRVNVGKLKVLPWRPFIDHIVAPPNSDVQRKYPERLLPHHRVPGQ